MIVPLRREGGLRFSSRKIRRRDFGWENITKVRLLTVPWIGLKKSISLVRVYFRHTNTPLLVVGDFTSVAGFQLFSTEREAS